MHRRIDDLVDQEFDIAVVGGGIQGIAVFYELAHAGLKVALIEKDDFAGATSANSLKVIHGGLRYLQTGNLSRMRRSIRARRAFMQLAPDLVRPQGFVIPTAKRGLQHAIPMRAALRLNDWISLDRNRGLPKASALPPGAVLPQRKLESVFAGDRSAFSRGAALWYDGLIHNAGRFSIALIKSAVQAGGIACNYTRAERYLNHAGKICGVEAIDCETGEKLAIRAKLVIDATATGHTRLQNRTHGLGESHGGCWLKATNLVLSRALCRDYAVGLPGTQDALSGETLPSPESRYFFFVPYSGHTLFGTFYFALEALPETLSVSEAEIDLMLAQAQQLCPEANLTRSDVSMSHVGVVPANEGSGRAVPAIEKKASIRPGSQANGSESLIVVQGVKYTESFELAKRVVSLVGTMLGRRYLSSPSERLPIDHADAALPIPQLVQKAVRDEMAIHLTDVVLRRTIIGELGYPGDELTRECAEAMASEAGWHPERVAKELALLRQHYQSVGANMV